jgi:hypothetical protein
MLNLFVQSVHLKVKLTLSAPNDSFLVVLSHCLWLNYVIYGSVTQLSSQAARIRRKLLFVRESEVLHIKDCFSCGDLCD